MSALHIVQGKWKIVEEPAVRGESVWPSWCHPGSQRSRTHRAPANNSSDYQCYIISFIIIIFIIVLITIIIIIIVLKMELTKLLQSSLECVAGAKGPPSIDKGADLGRSITYKQYYLQIFKNSNWLQYHRQIFRIFLTFKKELTWVARSLVVVISHQTLLYVGWPNDVCIWW